MSYLFLSREERKHPFIHKDGTLTAKYLYKLWEELRLLEDANSIISHCEDLFRKRGFTSVLMGYNAAFDTSHPSDQKIIFYNYTDFIEPYIERGYFAHDHSIHMARRKEPYFIYDTQNTVDQTNQYTSQNREAEEFASKHGIRYCLSFTLKLATGGYAAAGLVARATHGANTFFTNIERYGRDFWLLCCLIKTVIQENALHGKELASRLSTTQREYLWLYATHKTIKGVAVQKGMSLKTLYSHFDEIYEAVGVDTTGDKSHLSPALQQKLLEFGFYRHKM